jgi:thioredoxin
MPVIAVTERNFEVEVLRSNVPVLLEFGAEWCGPCKTVAPELAALAAELQGQAKICSVDIDKSPMLARQFGVQSVPTFVVIHQGAPVAAKAGAMRRAQLKEMLEGVLPRPEGALSAEEVADLTRRGKATLVDTRDAFAFGRAHLPGAVHVPLGEVPKRVGELYRRGQLPVLYCRAGDQTKELVGQLTANGTPVAFLEGGILGWEASGLPVEKPG